MVAGRKAVQGMFLLHIKHTSKLRLQKLTYRINIKIHVHKVNSALSCNVYGLGGVSELVGGRRCMVTFEGPLEGWGLRCLLYSSLADGL